MIGLKLNKKYRTLSGKICLRRQGLLNDPSPEKKKNLIDLNTNTKKELNYYLVLPKDSKEWTLTNHDKSWYFPVWRSLKCNHSGWLVSEWKVKGWSQTSRAQKVMPLPLSSMQIATSTNTDSRWVEAKKWWKFIKAAELDSIATSPKGSTLNRGKYLELKRCLWAKVELKFAVSTGGCRIFFLAA